jgi:hypothetical protein
LEFIGLTLSELDGKMALIIDYKNEEIYLIFEEENLVMTGKEAAFVLKSLEEVFQHLLNNFKPLKEQKSTVN